MLIYNTETPRTVFMTEKKYTFEKKHDRLHSCRTVCNDAICTLAFQRKNLKNAYLHRIGRKFEQNFVFEQLFVQKIEQKAPKLCFRTIIRTKNRTKSVVSAAAGAKTFFPL
jgi:hypothetical protein